MYLRTLELTQVQGEYFGHVVAEDLNQILRDIREIHKTDRTTADQASVAVETQAQLQEVISFEGSTEEKKTRFLLANFGIDYDAITKEQFITIIEVLKLSKHMKSPINKRGQVRSSNRKAKKPKQFS